MPQPGYQRAFKAGSQIGSLVRWRRDDSDQTRACAQSPARHGAATAVGDHRWWSGRGASWYEGVGDLLSGRPPPQSVLCHADHFHEPPVWVSPYDATCILSVVSTCIPDGGTCMSSFAMVRSGK